MFVALLWSKELVSKELHARRELIDKITHLTNVLSTKKEEYIQLKVNFMSHAIIAYDVYSTNHEMNGPQFELQQRALTP